LNRAGAFAPQLEQELNLRIDPLSGFVVLFIYAMLDGSSDWFEKEESHQVR
jgi:hypothetical protein